MYLFIYLSMEFLMGNFNNLTTKMCLQLMDVKNYHAGGGEIFDYYNGGRGGRGRVGCDGGLSVLKRQGRGSER